jgi:hypothetical protein
MRDDTRIAQIQTRYQDMAPLLDERARRQWAGSEALAYGYGGRRNVCLATGLAPNTISRGIKEVRERREHPGGDVPERLRRAGGGRKPHEQNHPGLPAALETLLGPATRGDPESPLRWTSKSTQQIARALRGQKYPVCPRTVARMLKDADYSLQANRKSKEGSQHPDRDAQFEHINNQCLRFMREGQPVISVDTKKKELVGEFKNNGSQWRRKGDPRKVRVHDFMDEGGKAIPYGVYDMARNEGWVSVGIDHDTAQFAAQAIWRWWRKMGSRHYKGATKILITCDGGGANSSRARLWKVALQELAQKLGMEVHVCHFPPGTSKWNKIEHRMFSRITQNWRGQPLVSHEVIIKLMANTTTSTGLKIKAGMDTNSYKTGIKVSDQAYEALNMRGNNHHADWNYSLSPMR